MAEVAAAPAPAAPAAPAPEVPPLSETIPYSKETQKQINRFYALREKNTAYGYDAKGDLEGPDLKVNLLRFASLKPDYRDAQEQLRLDRLASIETDLVAARSHLRDTYASGVISEILRANQAVADLEAVRSDTRSAVRSVISLPNPVTRDILLDQPYETRKLVSPPIVPYQYYDPDKKGEKPTDPFDREIVKVIYRDFAPTRFYGRYTDEEIPVTAKPEEEPEDTTRQALKDGRTARIVFDTEDENGFLSPMWPVEFTLGATRYFTALQAYEAERAKANGDIALYTSILKTRSARTIRMLTQKVTNHPSDAKALWLSIYTAIYQQYPELMEKLLATGTDAIVFADARPGPSGTGVSKSSPAILDPSRWKGENAVGLSQETVRSRARESTLEEAPVDDTATGVITEDEQKAAKVGAIINSRR